MKKRITAGALAGIAGGIVFGMMMQMMSAPTPDGGSMPMMGMVAKVVGSTSLAVGWAYHLFNSAVIGVLFAFAAGNRITGNASAAALGAGWGLLWWILGGLILMPILLGMPAFAPLQMPPMRPVAWGSLFGHLLFGTILGLSYVRLARPAHVQGMRAQAG